MYRNRERRRRRTPTENRRRSVFMRPSVQITILLITALVIYLILQNSAR